MKNPRTVVLAAVCFGATCVLSGQGTTPGQTGSDPKTVIRLGNAQLTGTEPAADDAEAWKCGLAASASVLMAM